MRLGLHVEIARDREQAVEHLPDRDILDRKTPDWFADSAKRCGELSEIMMRGHVARFEMDSATRA